MKPFGVWKYLLILFVLSLGFLYALPNLYAPDPAVQVSYTNSTLSPDLNLTKRLSKILEDNTEVETSRVELYEKYALIRLSSTEEQLKVKSLLSSAGEDLIVALNLASVSYTHLTLPTN